MVCNKQMPYRLNFAAEDATEKVQASQGRLKLDGTHQLPVYANYVNLLDENINTICKNIRFIRRYQRY